MSTLVSRARSVIFVFLTGGLAHLDSFDLKPDAPDTVRGEFQSIHHRTVDAFVDTIEQKVITRITAIEDNLISQSHSIVSLREKSLSTDDHLQRLLEAVEKPC